MEISIRQQWIIERAKYVFIEKGYFQTIMEDIAKASEITRRTLYRHFDTKEEIACYVTLSILSEMNEFAQEKLLNIKGNGCQKLELFLLEMIGYMLEHMDAMKYLGEYDFYFNDQHIITSAIKEVNEYRLVVRGMDGYLVEMLQLGIRDGSIRDDIDIQIYETTMAQVLWGFGQRIAIRGHLIEEETTIRAERLMKCQVNMYIDAIRKK